jgi:hypothetical protein
MSDNPKLLADRLNKRFGGLGPGAHLLKADLALIREAAEALNTRATPALPEERALLERVRERVEEEAHGDTGRWMTCSGCAEGVDGYLSNDDHPFSEHFQCQLGGGCGDCGGIGAVWDTTDYGALADELPSRDALSTPIAPLPDEEAVERVSSVIKELVKPFAVLAGACALCKRGDRLNSESVEQAARAILASIPSTEGGLREALDDLQQAEFEYRLMLDRHGDGSQAAGRAWDLMRRAGDKARGLLDRASTHTGQTEEGR